MRSLRIVNGVRAAFLVLCIWLGAVMAIGAGSTLLMGATIGGLIGSSFVAAEILASTWSIRGFTTGTFGLLVGIFCAWLVTRIDLFEFPWLEGIPHGNEVQIIYELSVYLGLAYIGTSLAVRSNREEFSFIVPYMRFRQEGMQEFPTVLDTNILIDSRILRLIQSKFLNGPFVIPRFVIEELQTLADSQATHKKERGKRGLEIIASLQEMRNIEVSVHDDFVEHRRVAVDARLIQIARRLGARILTNDVNLAQVAKVQSVPVLSLNDLADAMRPQLVIGETLQLDLVKSGKEDHQAIGYLPDGTMIVVNNAVQRIGDTVLVEVSSTIQTASGRLIFAELHKEDPVE